MFTLSDVVKVVKKAMRPLRHRVNNMVLLGDMLMVNNDKTPSMQAKTANNEVLDNVKFFQNYGFSSKPKKNAQAILLKIQGNPANVVSVAVSDRELRFQHLKDGEVAISDDSGNYIHLKNGGIMDVIAPNTINVKSKNINIINANNVVIEGKTLSVISSTATIKSETATIESQTTTVKAETATIEAQTTNITGKVNLAGGGLPIARVGDEVSVDPLTHKGQILSGSTEVMSG